jgi:hypothetical protein
MSSGRISGQERRAGEQEGEHDTAPLEEEEPRGAGEDGLLPGLGDGARERDGGAQDGADRGQPGAARFQERERNVGASQARREFAAPS